MKTLVYEGAHAEVEVPDAGIVAQRGQPVKVEDGVAKTLLKQDVWKLATQSEAERKAQDKADAEKAEEDNAAAEAIAKVRAAREKGGK